MSELMELGTVLQVDRGKMSFRKSQTYYPFAVLAYIICLLTQIILSVNTAEAKRYSGNSDNYSTIIKRLDPADKLNLAAGIYIRMLPIHNLNGKKGKPIVITGPGKSPHATFLGRIKRNTIWRNNAIIRNNVFSKAESSTKDRSARTNVLVGHFPLGGVGADDMYLIYGNFFYQHT
jgi:hypothetical protein